MKDGKLNGDSDGVIHAGLVMEVDQVRKVFGENVAVDDLSFEVKKGEVFGLLGPNGAGKTTLIRMLVGLAKSDSGRLSVLGSEDTSSPAVQGALGLTPQSLSIYDDLTAEENLRFFGGMQRLVGRRLSDRVDWVLDAVGLEGRRWDFVRTFSGGMKRRLNLAVSLIHDPRIILLDEPTVGVDPQSRNRIFDCIQTLNREQGLTVLYTTHYMEEAERLCDRVAVMDHGRLLALDTVDGLIHTHGGPAKVHVTFNEVPEVADSLPAKLDGTKLVFDSAQPLREINRLSKLGGGFSEMEINRPNLEDVFLHLTGRSLRD